MSHNNEAKSERKSLDAKKEEEEIKLRFIFQTEKLKVMLQVPRESRTPQLCQEISEIAGFLNSYKSNPDFLELCKNLYLKTYEKGQKVFKQGDFGDAFYVILNGCVKVFIDEPTAYKNFMQLKEIASLGKGDAFGEISLLYNSKRTATVIANETSDLIVLEKDAFQEFIKTLDSQGSSEMKTVHLNQLLHFLETLPEFQIFDRDMLVQLCTKCVVQKYPSQTILLKQGTEPTQMFIIKSGAVKVIKRITMNIVTHPELTSYGLYSSGKDLINKESYFELDILSDGDSFGDYALLNHKNADCSYMTSTPTVLVSISAFYLQRIIPQEILMQYKLNLKQYPEDVDLKQMFREQRSWSNYKDKLLKEVHKDKQNRKGFQGGLRLPTVQNKTFRAPINAMDIKSSDNRIYFNYFKNNKPNLNEEEENNLYFTKEKSFNQIGRMGLQSHKRL